MGDYPNERKTIILYTRLFGIQGSSIRLPSLGYCTVPSHPVSAVPGWPCLSCPVLGTRHRDHGTNGTRHYGTVLYGPNVVFYGSQKQDMAHLTPSSEQART